MCQNCTSREDADRLLWATLRRALLMAVKAIEARYQLGRDEQNQRRVA